MQLNAPNGKTVAFGPSSANLIVQSVSFDLVNHTFMVVYGPAAGGAPGQNVVVQGNIPAALQTALETHCQAVIENQNGWTAGSSTVAQP